MRSRSLEEVAVTFNADYQFGRHYNPFFAEFIEPQRQILNKGAVITFASPDKEGYTQGIFHINQEGIAEIKLDNSKIIPMDAEHYQDMFDAIMKNIKSTADIKTHNCYVEDAVVFFSSV